MPSRTCAACSTARCQVVWHPLGAADPEPPRPAPGPHRGAGGRRRLRFCRRLRQRLGDVFVPVLYVTADAAPAARLAPFEAGADTYLLRPFAPGELLAQVGAFLRIKEVHDRLAEKTAEVHRINRRLQQAYGQIDAELELARRIQMSFLPQSLPEVAGARFAVHYTLCGRVGGDFYDVFRLDEDHVGLYVADAMGHGVPASLLTIFVKKGVRAKEVFGQDYRLVPPDEVLGRLNRDLVEQAMPDHPFITMVYVLYNHREQSMTFARAGHPYPLHVPHDGEPRLWQVEGSLLGVFDTTFPVQSQQRAARRQGGPLQRRHRRGELRGPGGRQRKPAGLRGAAPRLADRGVRRGPGARPVRRGKSARRSDAAGVGDFVAAA